MCIQPVFDPVRGKMVSQVNPLSVLTETVVPYTPMQNNRFTSHVTVSCSSTRWLSLTFPLSISLARIKMSHRERLLKNQ